MSKRPPMRRGPWWRRWLCAPCDAGSCWMAVKGVIGYAKAMAREVADRAVEVPLPVRSMTRGVSLRAAGLRGHHGAR